MRKKITFGVFLFAKLLFSQQDPTSQNPSSLSNMASPNAAGFMRFQESSVNHYNGRSNFSIPIYEINVGGIKYPISLNYSQGGIQVNTMASDVGLGWSLTSTFINRTVVGDADLETINDTRQNLQKYKYGYFDFLNFWGDYDNGDPPPYIVDFYPDLFNFVSPSGSSRFYLKNKFQAVELDQKGSKIGWSIQNNTYEYLKDNSGNWFNKNFIIKDFDVFEITAKDGIEYTFRDMDLNHSFTDYLEYEEHSFGGIRGTYPRVSSWNISTIKNLNNNEQINFTYETYHPSNNAMNIYDVVADQPYYRYELICPTSTVGAPEDNIYYSENACNRYGVQKYFNRMLNVQRLKKISFRGGSVEFNYSNWYRLDLRDGRALTGIVVKDSHGNVIKEYELVYDYFQSNVNNAPSNEFSKRLKLLSVQEKGQNKYEFEYYEDQKLPNIGSELQDIFGYSNVEIEDGQIAVEPPYDYIPYYYYYPGKSEYGILPYYLQKNPNNYPIVDNFTGSRVIDKEPNDSSKTWSLKKIKFPTGGSNTYVLESNTFSLWGNNLKGGGTRIKQQIIQESPGGQQRTINYSYNKDANTTSGYLFNMPQLGHPTSILSNTELNSSWLRAYFLLHANAKINYDLTNNFFIGYSRVEENEDGIRTVYEFTNEEEPNIQTRFSNNSIGQSLISNSSYGNDLYIDNSYKRGKLKYTYYYEKNKTNPIMIKENVYKGYIGGEAENFPNRHYVYGVAVGYFQAKLMQFKKSYNTIYNNLVYTKTTKYLPSGNIDEISNMNYDVYQNLTEVSHKTGNGTTFPIIDLKKYLYPYNLVDPWSQAFEEINKYNTPILIKSYSGEINPANISNPGSQYLTSQSEIKFAKDTDTSSILMPTQALTAIGQNTFYEVGKFDRYDSKGNLLQSTKDGASTTYLYGYNQLYPIAKIEGATYEQVMIALGIPNPTNNSSYLSLNIVAKSNADIDETTENDLINFLDAFRKHANLANFRITTYTYNPLVGVTSVTPPSGMREVYIYEAVTNKLKEVKRMEKDAGGNDVYRTLKEYEYHYKP